MTFEEYQKGALDTDSSVGHETVSSQFFAIALGLMSEAGEVGEKLKKIYWAKDGKWNDEDKQAIARELGDVLWYIASLSTHIGIPMSEIANINLEKLKSRKERKVLNGDGDDR